VEAAAESGSPVTDAELARRVDEGILRGMHVGAVVIDRLYRTVTLNAAARRLLGIREHAPERDFLHSVRGIPYAEVRSAIDSALRDGKPVALRDVSLGPGDAGEERFVSLTIAPMGAGAPAEDHLVITVVDATETVNTRRELEAAEAAEKRIVEDLNATNAMLNATNKDLQDANEELQAANEELMLAQEELQATNEEFEATNEELQATNEELETNNEELQATNEELDTTNEELQARTAELEELNTTLRLQRERLVEIVERAPLPVVVLRGKAAIVESFNAPFAAMVGGAAALGNDVDHTFAAVPEVARGLREAVANGEMWVSGPQSLEDIAATRSPPRLYVFTALPLFDGGDAAGVAVFAQDMTGVGRG
jgi:two-component system CheB/CheR fusion protein